jgi:hypothetical protein
VLEVMPKIDQGNSLPALGFDCLDGAAPNPFFIGRKHTLPFRKHVPLEARLSLRAKDVLSPTGAVCSAD